jgi:hypothetical protein
MIKNFEVISENFNVARICSSGNYTHKWTIQFLIILFKLLLLLLYILWRIYAMQEL